MALDKSARLELTATLSSVDDDQLMRRLLEAILQTLIDTEGAQQMAPWQARVHWEGRGLAVDGVGDLSIPGPTEKSAKSACWLVGDAQLASPPPKKVEKNTPSMRSEAAVRKHDVSLLEDLQAIEPYRYHAVGFAGGVHLYGLFEALPPARGDPQLYRPSDVPCLTELGR